MPPSNRLPSITIRYSILSHPPSIGKLTNPLVNNSWIKEKKSKEIRKEFELNCTQNAIHQVLRYVANQTLEGILNQMLMLKIWRKIYSFKCFSDTVNIYSK